MHVPPIYRATDDADVRAVVRDYPLAVLVSNGPEAPFATHLPIVAAPGEPAAGGLAGTVLLGHLNRANGHWAALADGPQAQLIFVGPHHYITPAVYLETPAAPTWNYVSVHLRGRVEPITDRAETLRVVTLTAATFERDFGDGWSAADSHGYFARIVGGVGAFRFHVQAQDSMFKLSQEKSPEVRDRIRGRLAEDRGHGAELSKLMGAPCAGLEGRP